MATYASFLLILGSAALVGQAILIACGHRGWSRLAPAVGLAALFVLAWWTVRLPGHASSAVVAIALTSVIAGFLVINFVDGLGHALRQGLPVAFAAVALASLPFFVEGRFGILGTGLNPDMSQHLFAVEQLASGMGDRLINGGYPLGPHSLVLAVAELGPNTVQAFDGLMLAIAVSACLVGLGLLEPLSAWRRIAGALTIGFAYLVASYYTQGAFKETITALLLLAFAAGLDHLARGWASDEGGPRRVRALPLAVLVAGAAYVYSFPGVVWLGAAFALWGGLELVRAAGEGRLAGALATAREAAVPALVAGALALLVMAPELARMADFASFETFNPAGAGLGNLFDRLSPLEALGIWPSGDFRVEPGDGAVPAVAFYGGALFAAAALAFGIHWLWRERRLALVGATLAASLLWAYSLVSGTPYQEAKALLLLAPLVAAVSVTGLLRSQLPVAIPVAFLALAGASATLTLANGPVGPSGYSPQLVDLRKNLPDGSVRVIAPAEVLDELHGIDYLSWELRGNRLCIESDSSSEPGLTAGIAATVTIVEEGGALVPGETAANDHVVGPGPCPFVPSAARADPGADGN